MLLRKIDGEKNVQNCGFSAKFRNGDGGDMVHDQRQLSRTRTVIFRRYDTSPKSKSHRRWPGNPNGQSKVRNLRLFTLARLQLCSAGGFAADGGSSAADGGFQRSLEWHVADVKHILSDDQATLIVDRNSAICLFTLARSQLTLWWRLHGWRRSFKRHVADAENITGSDPAMTRIDRSSAMTKSYVYEIKQNVLKNFFLLLYAIAAITHGFFSTVTRNVFCSQLWKIISRRPWPPPKNRDIHIVEFFCRFHL